MARDGTVGASSASRGVWHALSVFPDERAKVAWTGALFFVVLASASIGLNVADALFFLRFGVDSLPAMIMLSGGVVMVVTIAYAAGHSSFGARTWSWTVTLALATSLVAERVAITVDLPGIYPVIWLTGQVVIYLGFTLLWDVAGELADTRAAKRLFPLFMSAGIAGAVTGNALTGPLASLFGTENLLVVAGVGLALAGVIARATTHQFVNGRTGQAGRVIRELASGFRTTVDVPLFRLVAGVGAALSVLFFLVFFPFSEVATASFDTEQSLAAFLGLFSSVATAVTFLVSLLVANRLFARFGVVAVLLVVAVVYVAGFGLWLVAFDLGTATLFRGTQWVAVNALGATAFSSLFNVLNGNARARTREFVAAVPVQIGTIFGGGLLMLTADLSHSVRTTISLAIAVAFLLMVVPMRKAYSAALVDAVRHGLSSVFTASMPGMQKPRHDADTLDALVAGVTDSDARRRRVSAAILGDVGGHAAEEALRELLNDADESVRLQALESLAGLDGALRSADAVRLVADPAVRVRRRAIALVQRGQSGSPMIRDALTDEDHAVRAHAARIVGGHTGRQIIDAMMETGDAAALAAAMRCIVAEPDLAHIDARRYVAHEDAAVRTAAAQLLAHRHDSVATLRRMVDDPSSEVRAAAAETLTIVDRTAVHDILEHGSVRARETALQALAAGEEPDPYLAVWAATELDRAAELHRYRVAIAARFDGVSTAAEYLVRVLEKREQMVERWVVTALGSAETRAALPLVARGAISGEADVKAEALEAIESLADRTLAHRLVALLEDPTGEVVPNRSEALQSLASDHQVWLRALAVRTIFDEFNRDLETTATTAASDESPIVRHAIPEHVPAQVLETAHLSVVDVVLALQQAPILSHLDPEVLEALAGVSEERRCPPGAVVYRQGTVGRELMVIIAGGAEAQLDDEAGTRVVATAGPGDTIGELGVLRRQPRTANVVAANAGLLAIVISGEHFLRVLEEQPEMATALLANLAERIAMQLDRDRVGDSALIAQA